MNGAAVAAVDTHNELPLVFRNSIFKDNHANNSGGALFIRSAGVVIVQNCQFEQNSAESGGALAIEHGEDYVSIVNSFFVFNEAATEGGAINCYNGQINIKGGYSISNSAVNGKGGFAYLSECQLYVLIHEYAISSNRALNGGGIYANKSIFSIGHITTMTNNSAARDGGALYLTDDSEIRFHFTVQSLLTLDHNMAVSKGGAIYVSDGNCERVSYPSRCFFRNLW